MSGFAPEKEITKVLIHQNLNIVRFCSSERNKIFSIITFRQRNICHIISSNDLLDIIFWQQNLQIELFLNFMNCKKWKRKKSLKSKRMTINL